MSSLQGNESSQARGSLGFLHVYAVRDGDGYRVPTAILPDTALDEADSPSLAEHRERFKPCFTRGSS
jgi:hypothetical protein